MNEFSKLFLKEGAEVCELATGSRRDHAPNERVSVIPRLRATVEEGALTTGVESFRRKVAIRVAAAPIVGGALELQRKGIWRFVVYALRSKSHGPRLKIVKN